VKISFTEVAEDHVRAIDAWWREHRTAAPALFANELAATISLLRSLPQAGRRVRRRGVRGVRLFLLRATRYHLFYSLMHDEVRVLAVWSAVRGAGPDLRER
jgi:plasmid stabilization system protein ParE